MKRFVLLLLCSIFASLCAFSQDIAKGDTRDTYIHTSCRQISANGVLFAMSMFADFSESDNEFSYSGGSTYPNILIKYPCSKVDDTYVIPENTDFIANYAFRGCKNLKKLIIPRSVCYIGEHAFDDSSIEEFIVAGATFNGKAYTKGKCDVNDDTAVDVADITTVATVILDKKEK